MEVCQYWSVAVAAGLKFSLLYNLFASTSWLHYILVEHWKRLHYAQFTSACVVSLQKEGSTSCVCNSLELFNIQQEDMVNATSIPPSVLKRSAGGMLNSSGTPSPKLSGFFFSGETVDIIRWATSNKLARDFEMLKWGNFPALRHFKWWFYLVWCRRFDTWPPRLHIWHMYASCTFEGSAIFCEVA